MRNHYNWLNDHLLNFFQAIELPGSGPDGWLNRGIIVAHGDKGYCYRYQWADAGIPFEHGMALYLLSYCRPYSQEMRETVNGWVQPVEWVIANYSKFVQHLPPLTVEKD